MSNPHYIGNHSMVNSNYSEAGSMDRPKGGKVKKLVKKKKENLEQSNSIIMQNETPENSHSPITLDETRGPKKARERKEEMHWDVYV